LEDIYLLTHATGARCPYPARGRRLDQAIRGACSGIDGQPAAPAAARLEPLGRRAKSAFANKYFCKQRQQYFSFDISPSEPIIGLR
jgi:hypothetical protein